MNTFEEWMNDKTVNRISKNGFTYGFRIIGRGEHLFFQENEKSLICEIDRVNNVIYLKSIRFWNTGARIKTEEKNRLISAITDIYKENLGQSVTFI